MQTWNQLRRFDAYGMRWLLHPGRETSRELTRVVETEDGTNAGVMGDQAYML